MSKVYEQELVRVLYGQEHHRLEVIKKCQQLVSALEKYGLHVSTEESEKVLESITFLEHLEEELNAKKWTFKNEEAPKSRLKKALEKIEPMK